VGAGVGCGALPVSCVFFFFLGAESVRELTMSDKPTRNVCTRDVISVMIKYPEGKYYFINLQLLSSLCL